MLRLSDPAWRQFRANHTNGESVARLLIRAETGESSDHWYDDLFQELCHQYTVSQAAYPAAPHLLRLATTRPDLRKLLLVLLGACYAFSEPSTLASIPPEIVEEWRTSAKQAIPLVAGLLAEPQPTESDLRYLLISLAAVQGFPSLASAIEGLDAD